MSLPTDLTREIAERAEQPGFDVVLDRARQGRRRRRTTIASGVVAAVVVAGVASWAPARWADSGPDPAEQSPTGTPTPITGEVDERLPAEVRDLLGSERIDPWQVAGSGGAIAVLWRACDDADCELALVTRLGDRVTGSLLEGATPTITEVPDGWLVHDASGAFRLSADGERTPVTEPGSTEVPPEAGDTAVETPDGWRLLRGAKLIPLPTPDGSDALAGYVTPAGELVVATSPTWGAVQMSWVGTSGSWRIGDLVRTTEPVSGALVAGHHDAVALTVLGDVPDGSVPVLEVAVSGDAGHTWTRGRGLPSTLRDPSSLAVSDEGTAYLTTGSDGAVRVDAEGNTLPVGQSTHDRSAFQVSHRVCFVAETGRVDQLRCSADDAASWTVQSLPGFR